MRRRLIILFGSLMILGLILGVVSLFPGESVRDMTGTGAAPIRSTPDPVGKPGIGEGERSIFVITDKMTKEVRVLINAETINKRDDGSYVLTHPFVEMRQEGGQRIYVSADGAEMWIEETGDSAMVPRGRLFSLDQGSRNVRIYVDRTTVGDRPSYENAPGATAAEKIESVFRTLTLRRKDMVRIWAEDLSFDLDVRELSTEFSFLLMSAEADISGHGLLVQWNEAPEELRLLQVNHGQSITLHNMGEEANFISMPGEEKATAPVSLDDEPGALVADTGLPGEGEMPVEGEIPAEGDVSSLADVQGVGDPADDIPPMVYVPADGKPPVRNMISATFYDSVAVQAGPRRLWDADRLSLDVEIEQDFQTGLKSSLADEVEPGVAATADVASERVGTDEVAVIDDAIETEGGEGTTGEVAAGDATEAPPSEPVTITWRGALVVRPTGYTPTPDRNNYTVSAVGNDVHLKDTEATIVCNRAVFRNPARTGEISGSAGDPARLYLEGGQELVCQEIGFNLPTGKITMVGPGSISQGSGGDAGIMIADMGDNAGGWSAGWQDEAIVTLVTGERMNGLGEMEEFQYFDNAIFYEDVVLTQSGPPREPMGADIADGAMPDYDFLRCDVMRIWMKPQEGSSIVPESAVAQGNVVALMQDNLIHAGNIDVHFDEVETVDEEGAVSMQIQPGVIVARNGVRFVDQSDPELPSQAQAAIVQIDAVGRRAVLFGTSEEEATISQGENILAGREIALNEKTMSAVVKGAGHMRLVFDTDLNGRELDEPRPADIAWTQKMEFFGQKNEANFIGDVDLVTLTETVRCEQLRLVFEKDESAAAEAEPDAVVAAQEQEERRMGLSIERYGKRKLAMIMAFDDVALGSTRYNEADELIRRFKVTGDKLMYDAPVNELSIFGEGTLLLEDYELDMENGKPKMRADSTGNMKLQSPSQTAILWNREMQFLQDDNTVNVYGEVTIIHRSGSEVQAPDPEEGPRVPDWGTLDSGLKGSVICDELTAIFAPAPEVEDAMAHGEESGDLWDSGPAIGPLEFFQATGHVDVHYGDMSATAGRMNYDRRTEEMVLLGSLPGQPEADTTLIYSNEETGEFKSWSRPKMTIELEDGEITRVKVHESLDG